ncbi:MAG: hypothetical protein H6933_02470 [Burkholderiaceae bacterium]|nr:hypothetical protein [Burkholderiaceae bacterium]
MQRLGFSCAARAKRHAVAARLTPTLGRKVGDVLLLEKLEAQLHRTHISQRDFEEAMSYLWQIQFNVQEETRRGLLTAAVVAYGRPFIGTNRRSSKKATPTVKDQILKSLETEEAVLHQQVLGVRNRAVAHSEYELRPVRYAGNDGHGGFALSEERFDLLQQGIDVEMLHEVCRKLSVECLRLKATLVQDMRSKGGAA